LTVFRQHLDTYRSSDFNATMPHARRKLHNFANDANSSHYAATNLNDYCLLPRYHNILEQNVSRMGFTVSAHFKIYCKNSLMKKIKKQMLLKRIQKIVRKEFCKLLTFFLCNFRFSRRIKENYEKYKLKMISRNFFFDSRHFY